MNCIFFLLLFSKLLKSVLQNIYDQYKYFRILISFVFCILILSHVDTAILSILTFIYGLETLDKAELQVLMQCLPLTLLHEDIWYGLPALWSCPK